jgi:hypothetical protein
MYCRSFKTAIVVSTLCAKDINSTKMGHSVQKAANERETGKTLSHVRTRPLLQDGSWQDRDVLH